MVFWTFLDDRVCFEISGKEVLKFLQGLITADTTLLSKEFPCKKKSEDDFSYKTNLSTFGQQETKTILSQGLWSAFLTPQGRFLGDFFLVPQEITSEKETIILECHKSYGEILFQRLKFFSFRRGISFSYLPNYKTFVLWPQNRITFPQQEKFKDCLKDENFLKNIDPLENFLKGLDLESFLTELPFSQEDLGETTINKEEKNEKALETPSALIFKDPRNTFLEKNSCQKEFQQNVEENNHENPLGYRLILDTGKFQDSSTLSLRHFRHNQDLPQDHCQDPSVPEPVCFSKKIIADLQKYLSCNFFLDKKPHQEAPEKQWTFLPMDYYKTLSISKGIPSERDLESDKSIILEYGYHHLGCISWNKGCYLGQELMARTFHRGLIRKKIYILLKIKDSIPPPQTQFTWEDQKIGVMKSAVESMGLALLNTDYLEPGIHPKIQTDQGVFQGILPDFYQE